jgi:hypothetical protein
MVVGLDKFAAHFADFQDRYILIGGAATWLVLDEAGIEPRATRDLDIVLCLEALDAEFTTAFWRFIELGKYEIQEKSQGQKIFYRFKNSAQTDYPYMLELFSRKPDILALKDDSHLTPIPVGEDVASLSAILLDENYYAFIHQHKRELDGVSLVGEKCLIPLKARAWLDLTKRRAAGEQVDSRNMRKHRGDVLRLFQILSPELRVGLPDSIRNDLRDFLEAIVPELDQQLLKSLEIKGISPVEILNTIKTIYGIPVG